MITVTYIRIMKKVLLAAMVLLAGASFTSCSSSDDDDNEKQGRSQTYGNAVWWLQDLES